MQGFSAKNFQAAGIMLKMSGFCRMIGQLPIAGLSSGRGFLGSSHPVPELEGGALIS
jgi:hypothetical protein